MASDIQGTLSITGIGVRVSIYIHAFLAPVALWAQYARYGALSVDSTRTVTLIFDRIIGKLLLIGVALFITAIVHTKSPKGLSSVEGLVVLNLMWIVNTAILSMNIATHVLGWPGPCPGSDRQREERNRFHERRGCWNAYPFSIILHSMLLAAFGLWFWTSPNIFPDDSPSVSYWIFGRIPIHNSSLCKVSLAIYSISAIPGINIVFHAIITLSIPASIMSILMASFKRFDNKAFEYLMHATAMFAFLAQPIYLIVSTEAVIRTNSLKDGSSFGTWNLGDTVFLLVAVTSIRSTVNLTIFSWRLYFPGINNSVQAGTAQPAAGSEKDMTMRVDQV